MCSDISLYMSQISCVCSCSTLANRVKTVLHCLYSVKDSVITVEYTIGRSSSSLSATKERGEAACSRQQQSFNHRRNTWGEGDKHLYRYSGCFSCLLSSCRLFRPPGVVVLGKQCVAPWAHQHCAITFHKAGRALRGALIHASLCIYLVPRPVFALQVVHTNCDAHSCSSCIYASLYPVNQVRHLAPRMASQQPA